MKNLGFTLSLLFVFSLFTFSTLQAQSWWGKGIKGEGERVRKSISMDNFTGIDNGISANVYIKQGSRQSVEIDAQENIIENIKTDVNGDTWRIRFYNNVRNHKRVNIYITIPTLTEAKVSGSGNIEGQSDWTGLNHLELKVSGSGNIDLNVEAKEIETGVSGSGAIQLAGSTYNHEMRVSGSGDIEAFNLKSNHCNIRISGSGECEVYVQDKLDARVSGSGDVYYKGNPNVKSKISGSGDVESRN